MPLVLLIGAMVFFLWRQSSTIVEVAVEDGEPVLRAGPAVLPLSVIDRTMAVPALAKDHAMGRQLDPAAYVVHHGWVPEMVMIVLDDPEDPTPYWLISSTNPEAVLSAIASHGGPEPTRT